MLAEIASAVDLGPMILVGKVWAIGYVLVVLGILLGVASVCRPPWRKVEKRRIV